MYSKPILTKTEYETLKAKYNKYEEMRKQVCKSPNCVDVDEQKILAPWHVENEQISQMEVYEFITTFQASILPMSMKKICL